MDGRKYLQSFLYSILDLLFPEKCFRCKKRGTSFCDACVSTIRPAQRETSTTIYALYDYRDPYIKKAIWDLKYHHMFNLGRTLGKLLYEGRIEEVADIRIYTEGQPICVIPVPMSPAKLSARGYNQAEIIAKGFVLRGEKDSLELKNNIVLKTIDTTPQARITNRNIRLRNIHNVFSIKNQEQIKGRAVIVVDDVTTTGGTLTEIMKLLRKSGAKKVVGFAVAH